MNQLLFFFLHPRIYDLNYLLLIITSTSILISPNHLQTSYGYELEKYSIDTFLAGILQFPSKTAPSGQT